MQGSTERPNRLYLPGIDAMRGVVVLIGLLFHANVPFLERGIFRSGLFFVDVFGVLSGYLITRVLLGEHMLTGKIDFKRFYLARARRLMPALFAVLVAVVLYARAFEPQTLWDLRVQTLAAMGYFYNWYAILSGGDYFSSYEIIPLQHLWSLSLEEQFYIVWPVALVVMLVASRRRPRLQRAVPYVLVGGALLSAVVAFAIFHGGDTAGTTDMVRAPMTLFGFEANRLLMVYMSTITRAGGFLAGAALAFWWQPDLRPPTSPRFDRLLDIAGLLSMVAMVLLTNLQWFTEAAIYESVVNGGAVLVWIICAVLIMAVSKPQSTWMQRLFVKKPLIRLGVVSYALYLYHWPVMQFYRKQPFNSIPLWGIALMLPVLWAIAELSQKYFERPIRKMGFNAYLASLAPRTRRVSVTVGGVAILAAVVSLVTAPAATSAFREDIDRVEQSASGIAPGETAERLVIGDSITALLTVQYQQRGYVVDAVVARTFAEGSGMAEYSVETGQVTDAVVMHLGTNEEITPEALRGMLDRTSTLRRVVLVTLWRENWSLLEKNNAALRSMAAEYPNVVVADWNAVAAQDPSYYIMADGIHIARGAGVEAYLALVDRAVNSETGGIVVGVD
ncbi:MAG: acyltransferase [Acidobacteria bacterium]|nr:acyltransferase [Acidobacteriota bacterium]